MNYEEIVAKYGETKMKFSSYYKYSFTFKGITGDGEEIFASIGGESDDIYRTSISADTETTLKNLEANGLTISKAKKEIASWYSPW